MQRRYHIEIIHDTLNSFFSPASLREIWRANIGQDSIRSMFGHESRRHVCDCQVADSLAYIDEEHALIEELCQDAKPGKQQRAALGRLLHTVHDLYAHTPYVALWVSQSTLDEKRERTPIHFDGLDPAILGHAALQVARWDNWREPLYYIPFVGHVLRHCWVAAGSHEAIHLDSPKRGANYALAMTVTRQRTMQEYARAVAAIREIRGPTGVAQFHDSAENVLETARPVARRERSAIMLSSTDSSLAGELVE